jgi:hypothetical protein
MLRAAPIVASAGIFLAVFFVTWPAHAQSANIDKYCKTLYGDQSSAVLENNKDPKSWRCTKGNGTTALDLKALCNAQFGADFNPVLANPDDPKSWSCVSVDRTVSGAVTSDRVNADIEKSAKERQESGKAAAAFARKYYFFLAANPKEFAALAKYTVFLISVWTRKEDELPIRRVYVRVKGEDTAVMKVAGRRSEEDGKSLVSQMFGSHREDGIYLVPTGAMLRDGQIMMDFAANRSGYVLLKLPANVALEHAKKNAMLNDPDAPASARPDLGALQDFIRRKLPGFPVPDKLP